MKKILTDLWLVLKFAAFWAFAMIGLLLVGGIILNVLGAGFR